MNETHEPALRARLQRVNESATRSAHLVNQLLTLARAEPESATEHGRSKVDLRKLAADLSAEMVPRALATGIDLGLDGGDDAPPLFVLGHAFLLREALTNLIDNALRYAGRGSVVTVRLRTQGQHAVLEVEDNGPGVPEPDRERIFQRFVRATHEGNGCGLGLAIVKEIVGRHGGSIMLEAATPRGLRAVMRLPRAS